jgi:hypothetical protein
LWHDDLIDVLEPGVVKESDILFIVGPRKGMIPLSSKAPLNPPITKNSKCPSQMDSIA